MSALLRVHFYSDVLNLCVSADVILPQRKDLTKGHRLKCLWLLHGMYGNHNDWTRKTALERYVTGLGLAVVMPSGLNSCYVDMAHGGSYYTFITEELPAKMRTFLPISDRREDNFIAGLSMGGRGTIKFAVNFPEKFAAAATLSAAPVDFSELAPGAKGAFRDTEEPRLRETIKNAGGLEAYINSEENVWAILDRYAAGGEAELAKLPRLMFACGEDDHLYENFSIFRAHCEEAGIPAEWFTLPGYKHEWRFWDAAIQHALTFFGLDEEGGNPY